ncbi:MAG: class I SAM-dependent methyltransferase [Acidimicrobiales bacterium]
MHRDRRRAGSFGDDAAQYDRARPSYPSRLVDDLVGPDIHRVLDVGCGTGIAARLFAARGCAVLGVEADERMAAVARRTGIEVAVAPFETWTPTPDPFDLVIAAQSWHWIDPTIGASKAGSVLRPAGRFAAFWNGYRHSPEVRAALIEVYKRHAPDLAAGSLSLGGAGGAGAATFIDALTASDLFEPVERRSYPSQRAYTREEWLDQLQTHSDHRTMEPATLKAILSEVGGVIDGRGGTIIVDHPVDLITARRLA